MSAKILAFFFADQLRRKNGDRIVTGLKVREAGMKV
jgi:hypothetical protein